MSSQSNERKSKSARAVVVSGTEFRHSRHLLQQLPNGTSDRYMLNQDEKLPPAKLIPVGKGWRKSSRASGETLCFVAAERTPFWLWPVEK